MELVLLKEKRDEANKALLSKTIEENGLEISDTLLVDWYDEIDKMHERMQDYPSMDVGEVLAHLAGVSARLSHIRTYLVRYPAGKASRFRTQIIDKTLEEVDRQFKAWSRVLSVRQMEWDISKGGM